MSGYRLHHGRRAVQVALLLLAGGLLKTGWDVVLAPRPAAAAVAPTVSAEPELSALPRPPAKDTRHGKTKRSAGRAVKAAPAALPVPPLIATKPPEPESPPEPEPAPTYVPVPLPVPAAADEPISFDNGNGEAIARAIANAKRAAVQRCFERELKRSPELTGNVTVELDLAPPQQVHAVRVNDDLNRPEFTACVTAAMQQLSFTGLNEEVSVQLPYRLSPKPK